MLRALTLCLALAGPVSAQTCAYSDEILEGSWAALAARPEISGFGGARAGLDAAYLILRYGDQNPAVAEAVFAALETGRRPHPQLDDLRLTYAIWRDGPEAALAGREDPVRAVAGGWWSVQRAIILSDGGETFLGLMAAAQDRDEIDVLLRVERAWAGRVAGYLTDQSDGFKAALASRAEDAGFPLFAAYLLSDMADPAPFFAYLETLDPETAERLDHPATLGLSVSQGQVPITLREVWEFDPSRAVVSARLMSPADYLLIVLNQTGEVEAVVSVVERLAAAEAAGQFDPVTDMDVAWVLAFDELVEELGADRVTASLAGFDMPSQRYRHFGGPGALGSIADMAAIQRLAPYAAGEGDSRPEAHPHLPYPDGWVEAAETIRSGGVIRPEFQAEAAELLFVGGQIENAVHVARNISDANVREAVLTDFIKRLDRLCEGATYFPMQGLILAGDHMWDFPER